MICEGKIKIPYSWPAGELGSHFLTALRDRMQVLGLRCPSCEKVLVPPMRCLNCDRVGTEWVQVGPQGVLEVWTVVRTPVSSIDIPPAPYAVGVIRLDGADTGLVHLVGDVDFGKLRSGILVEPVFSQKRRGHILDIRYFRPIE
jgi:uncharacterized OB-fold protein